mmetsp:Transcript_52631/g.97035  ORF Transcript_52631/g.97035 Transcript_52631/m.97035 type:complete len:202 (-) Transcript_52631:15-620(-)
MACYIPGFGECACQPACQGVEVISMNGQSYEDLSLDNEGGKQNEVLYKEHYDPTAEVVICRDGPQWSNLGINCKPTEDKQALVIEYMDTHGLIPDWNAVQEDSRRVEVGHHIIGVNDIFDSVPDMVAELKSFSRGSIVRLHIAEMHSAYRDKVRKRFKNMIDDSTGEGRLAELVHDTALGDAVTGMNELLPALNHSETRAS